MSTLHRSRVIRLVEAQARIPGPAGEHAIVVFQRGPLDIALSLPQRPSQQTPHGQDQIYILRGRGVLLHDGKREPFESGDLLFVAAGIERSGRYRRRSKRFREPGLQKFAWFCRRFELGNRIQFFLRQT